MEDRLRYLVLEAWEHDHPPGPLTDLDYQSRARDEWIATLTAEDCVTLADWLTNPVVPDDWGIGESWHWQVANGLAYYVGKGARRHRDKRVEDSVAAMIRHPSTRHLGLDCAMELRCPALFGDLLLHLDDERNRVGLCLALAASATREQIGELRQLALSSETSLGARSVILDAIAEWEQSCADIAPDPPGL